MSAISINKKNKRGREGELAEIVERGQKRKEKFYYNEEDKENDIFAGNLTDEDSDSWIQDTPTPLSPLFNKTSLLSNSESKFDRNLSDEDVSEDENEDDKKLRKLKDDFATRFKALSNDKKWKLPSGRYVEDVLYSWAITQNIETVAHSFILDTDCQEIMDLFGTEEREMILNTSKKVFPELQDDIKKYVMSYYKKKVSDLRQRIMTSYLKDGETYNPQQHYDLDWIRLAFNKFVIEWEQDVNALADNNLESWIVCHVWTFIVDMALKNIEGTQIGKADGGSLASKTRKNKKRKIGNPITRSRKVDLLLKIRNSSREIFAGEVARTGDIHHKKYWTDRVKLLKLMKDMLELTIELVPPTTIENYRNLCTFGIQLYKNKGSIYIMDCPGGSITRLTKKAQLEAPLYITGIRELILSIITMLELKNAIREMLKILEKIEDDEFETQIFQRHKTSIRLQLAETTTTPKSSP